MEVRIDLHELYIRGDEPVIALSLLYRLAKLGDEVAKEKFRSIVSDPKNFDELIGASNENHGNIFLMLADLFSFDEVKSIHEALKDEYPDPQAVIEDMVDCLPVSYIREHISYFDEQYEWLDEDESILDFLVERSVEDGIFYYVEDINEKNPFKGFSDTLKKAKPIGIDLMNEDCTIPILSMYARYVDAKSGIQEALRDFSDLCLETEYIELVCEPYNVFDYMMDLLPPENIVRILSSWNEDTPKNIYGKDSPVINAGKDLCTAFMEQNETFYSENEKLFQEYGLENLKPE